MPVQGANFIRSYEPIWYLPDLFGKPLDDTYWLFTLQNTLPYLPQNIWQDPDGNVVWSDPIQFLANGTLPNNLYWDPTLVYRLEVRQGQSQDDPLIYLVENYVPVGTSDVPIGNEVTTDNQITNPQFATVDFIGTITDTVASAEIAPGWTISTTGSGSLSIAQVAIPGSSNIDTNPPFAISITNNGFNSVTLTQRFDGNGGLWAGEVVSVGFTASATQPIVLTGSINYSNGTPSTEVISADVQTGYVTFSNAIKLPDSLNPDNPPGAWTDLELSWVGNTTVNITSVQVVAEFDVSENGITYEQTTPQRQVDQQFHYWQPKMNFQGVSSYTVGWDFGFNPSQIWGENVTFGLGLLNNQAKYASDQLIAFESLGGLLTYNLTPNGLLVTNGTTASKFALMQYLGLSDAQNLLSHRNSVKMRANISSGTVTGQINIYWSTNTSPAVPVLPTVFFSNLNGGIPTSLASGWTQVPRQIFGPANFTLTTTMQDFDFPWFDATALSTSTATAVAIVISFNQIVSQTVTVDYCSVVPGDIPSPPAYLSAAATLQSLQGYFETSFGAGIIGQASSTNQVAASWGFPLSNSSTNIYSSPTSVQFKTTKRTNPGITTYSTINNNTMGVISIYYSLTGTVNTIGDVTLSTFWTALSGHQSFTLESITAASMQAETSITNAWAYFNWFADARLGVIT